MDNENTNQTPQTPPAAGAAPTVRLKPIVIKPNVAASTPVGGPSISVKPAIPGVVPRVVETAPVAPAPVTIATEAAKSKTSRISLEAAQAGGEVRPAAGPKTIRLKRPVGSTVSAAMTSPEGGDAGAPKTLRIKPSGDSAPEGTITLDGEGGGIVIAEERAESTNVIFPLVAILAILVILGLIGFLAGPRLGLIDFIKI